MKTRSPKSTDLSVDYRERKFVYMISHLAYPGEYRIGIARNVNKRLVDYQTADPGRDCKIEFKLETPSFREIEKYIHAVFENRHEWIAAELGGIVKAIKEYRPDQ